MKMRKFHKSGKATFLRVAKWVGTAIVIMFFAAFMDWLIFNWLSGCCEGGICIPDVYPQCRNPSYDSIYGAGYYEQFRKAD